MGIQKPVDYAQRRHWLLLRPHAQSKILWGEHHCCGFASQDWRGAFKANPGRAGRHLHGSLTWWIPGQPWPWSRQNLHAIAKWRAIHSGPGRCSTLAPGARQVRCNVFCYLLSLRLVCHVKRPEGKTLPLSVTCHGPGYVKVSLRVVPQDIFPSWFCTCFDQKFGCRCICLRPSTSMLFLVPAAFGCCLPGFQINRQVLCEV